MEKYFTPNIDAALLSEGYVRPNESLVYVRKNNDIDSKWKYKIVFPIPDINLYSMEEWYDKLPYDKFKQAILNYMEICSAVTYTTDHEVYEKILMLTADFYYHCLDMRNHKRYVHMFETFSGKKY
jgi:hypothetical protein